MILEESGKPETKKWPEQVNIDCHEEKHGAYTRLYKRQVLLWVRVMFCKPAIIKKESEKIVYTI